MEALVDKLLYILAAFGIGVVLVFGLGLWLFNSLKKAAERQSKSTDEKPPAPAPPNSTDEKTP